MKALLDTCVIMDAVMAETALRENMDCIVTRNLSDYQNAPLPVYAPQEFLNKRQEEVF